MFGSGSSGFGGFGQTNANTAPGLGTTQGSIFGQANTTPASTSAFGSSPGGFGQQNTSTGSTGMFGAQTNTGSSGFGGFGSASKPPAFGSSSSTPVPMFGQNANSTTNPPAASPGFSFGSQNTSAAPVFGSSTGTGMFGKPAATTGFGSANAGGGMFGGGSTSTGSGTAFGGFGNSAGSQIATGTSNPVFQATQEKDAAGTQHFQTITCMPAYRNYSVEELRLQDYAQGRRYGNDSGSGGAFGQNTGFGGFGQSNQPANTGFGSNNTSGNTSSGIFGNTPSNQTSSGFGANTSTGFGSNTGNTNSIFKPATGTGMFGGTSNNTNQQSSGFLGGGAGTANIGFGSGTNAFGSQPQASTGTGVFGNTSTSTGFGQNQTQNKPAFSFGGSTPQTTGFGATNPAPAFGGANTTGSGSGLFGGGFGQAQNQTPNQNQNPTPSGGFSFGGANTNTGQSGGLGSNLFNNTSSTFGQNQNNQQKPQFSFGPTANTNSTFGQNSNTQNKTPFSFGPTSGTNTSGNTGTNTSFGGNTGTGLFGNNTSNTGSSLFGNNNSTSNNTSNLFNKPNTPSGGLFGNQAQPQTTGLGSSIFGGTNNNSGGGLFGNASTSNQPNFGAGASTNPMGSFNFGSTNNQNQPQLTASIDQNPFGSNPLFNSMNSSQGQSPGPIAAPLASPVQKKKPAMIPHYKLSPRAVVSPRLRSLRPMSSLNSLTSPGSPSFGPRLSNAFDGMSEDAMLTPDAFSPRQSMKKLIIDRKITQADLLSDSGSPLDVKKPIDENVNTQDNRLLDQNALNEQKTNNSPAAPAEGAPSSKFGFVDGAKENGLGESRYQSPLGQVLETANEDRLRGTYWTSPPMSTLLDWTHERLSSVKNFKVGRRGYGQVSFISPVNLTSIPAIEEIPEKIVVFEPKICTVYPDETEKPPVGQGLNVPALITLENCFPKSRDTRDVITDINHPRFVQHVERLKKIRNTEFVDFLADSGSWMFRVEHFSRYGLDDESDEDEVQVVSKPELGEAHGHDMSVDISQDDSFKYTRVVPRKKAHQRIPGAFDNDMSTPPRAQPVLNPSLSPIHSLPSKSPTEEGSEVEQSSEPELSTDHSSVAEMVEVETEGYADSEEYTFDEQDRPATWVEQQLFAVRETPQRDFWPQESIGVGRLSDGSPIFQRKAHSKLPLISPMELDELLYGRRKNKTPAHPTYESMKSTLGDVEFAAHAAFKPRWHGSKLLYRGTLCNNGFMDNTPSDKLWQRDCLQSNDEDVPRDTFSRLLTHCTIRSRDGIPEAQMGKNIQTTDFIDIITTNEEDTEAWRVVGALYDEIPPEIFEGASKPVKEVIERRYRKQALSEWLEEYLTASVEQRLATSPEESVYIYITAHQIEEAMKEAQLHMNYRLANIISLLGGDRSIRADARAQLRDWRERESLRLIPREARLVLELLAGNTGESSGSGQTGTMHLSAGLGWQCCFGLRLWYEIQEDDPIELAFRKYDAAQQADSHVTKPIARDHAQPDLVYSILKAYSDASYGAAQCAEDYVPFGSLRFSMRWLLMQFLSTHRPLDPMAQARLCLDFAWELEAAGAWEWAIFVVMFCQQRVTRASVIKAILSRNISDADPLENFLTALLKIPVEWILEAKALHARSQLEHDLECTYLLQAQAWNEAHRCFMGQVAPDLVIANDTSALHHLLAQFEHPDAVFEWRLGGQIYLDYIHLLHPHLTPAARQKGLPRDNRPFDRLSRLLSGLPLIPVHTFAQHVAVAEMSAFTASYALANSSDLNERRKVMSLPLTKDQRLEKTMIISTDHLKTQLGR